MGYQESIMIEGDPKNMVLKPNKKDILQKPLWLAKDISLFHRNG